MKKVLITGIDGFTGVYLEQLILKAGYEVYGTVHPKSVKKTHIVCNIADKRDIISTLETVRPDYIVHLAGISFVPHSDTEQIYRINLFGTLNILDALIKLDMRPRKIVIASSANVYGNSTIEVVDEGVCPAPVSHYAVSKLAMEFMARTYFDRLNILITRPFNYTGVGQCGQFLIPKIVSHFKQNKTEIELGNLDVVRDFSDVRFVAEMYKKLMECDTASATVNICSGKGVSLTDVIATMQSLTRHTIAVKVNTDFVRKNEVKKLIGSNNLLFSLVGEQKISPIEETLRWMLEA
jgi:nucleoside-diphosphate-sugar epimerase